MPQKDMIGLSPLDVRLGAMPTVDVSVDAGHLVGPAEMWRHALSQGGFGPEPLPGRVVEAVRQLRPRRIRVFLQEFFDIYTESGRFDWTRLDGYMDALAETGADVVACLTIKPRLLFPTIDQSQWRPSDVAEWQRLVTAMVRRYSTERQLVTHWEILNEPNLATGGGAPFTIPDPNDYFEFYRFTSAAVLEAEPTVGVGGPSVSGGSRTEPLPGFVELCKRHGTRLDFVSWHLYSNDAAEHARGVEHARELVEGIDPAPDLFYTEWNRSWAAVSTVEIDDDPAWASTAVAVAVATRDAGLDWGYFYRIWDRSIDPARHAVFTPPERLPVKTRMANSASRRLGMFSELGTPRPSYFAFKALAELQDDRIATSSNDHRVVTFATAGGDGITVLLASDCVHGHVDRIVNVEVAGVPWDRVRYRLFRIDDDKRWDAERLELLPVEERTAWTYDSSFWCSLYLPAAALAVVTLAP